MLEQWKVVLGKCGRQYVDQPIVIDVSEGHAHVGLCLPISTNRDPAGKSRLFERTVALIQIQIIRIGIIRHLYETDMAVDADTIATMDAAYSVLKQLGAVLEEIQIRPLYQIVGRFSCTTSGPLLARTASDYLAEDEAGAEGRLVDHFLQQSKLIQIQFNNFEPGNRC